MPGRQASAAATAARSASRRAQIAMAVLVKLHHGNIRDPAVSLMVSPEIRQLWMGWLIIRRAIGWENEKGAHLAIRPAVTGWPDQSWIDWI